MSQIKLSVTEQNGVKLSPAQSKILETSHMFLIDSVGGNTVIIYEDKPGEWAEFKVSESIDTINQAIGTAFSSSGFKPFKKAKLDATSGLAIGTHDLVDSTGNPVTIPNNAIAVNAYYVVETTFTSSTDAATISLDIASDDVGGIVSAIAISDASNPWDAGNHDGIQDGVAANFSVQTTAERKLQATVGTEALTNGALTLYVEFVTV